MGQRDQHPLSPYFGDYPDGVYWSAVRSDRGEDVTAKEAKAFSYQGSTLRIMWDESAGPLWGDRGLLGDDPRWMRRDLGLSDGLIADLLGWHDDMTEFSYLPASEDWEAAQRQLDDRGHELAARLQDEVGTRYRVWYHA